MAARIQVSSLISLGLVFALFLSVREVSPLSLAGLLVVPSVLVIQWQSRQVRTRAALRRREMDQSISVFLDLVNVLLAGGAGIESSLLAAAQSGNNWAFTEIRSALIGAQSARQSSWDSLRALGERIGVESLIDIGHSVQLAGEHGARVRQTLLHRASSIRLRNMAEIESIATANTEKMGIPMVLLFVAFIVLVGYPAYATAIGSL
jgi:Flp pilus assembly protein TadB